MNSNEAAHLDFGRPLLEKKILCVDMQVNDRGFKRSIWYIELIIASRVIATILL